VAVSFIGGRFQKVYRYCQILLNRAETNVVLINFVLKDVICHFHAYAVAVSCHSLYMNQVSEKIY
jgi:hypothetical protein